MYSYVKLIGIGMTSLIGLSLWGSGIRDLGLLGVGGRGSEMGVNNGGCPVYWEVFQYLDAHMWLIHEMKGYRGGCYEKWRGVRDEEGGKDVPADLG